MAAPVPIQTAIPPKWKNTLSDAYFVNSVAISGRGGLVLAGTFYHDYNSSYPVNRPDAPPFGTYCFDRLGNQLWSDKFDGFEGIYSVAISRDGSIAASGGWRLAAQGIVRAYCAANGSQLLSYSTGNGRVSSVALSDNGATLVAASYSPSPAALNRVYLFQRSDGLFPPNPAVFQLEGNSSPLAVAIAPDGGWFVVGCFDGSVYLVENANGSIGKSFRWQAQSPKEIRSIAVSRGQDIVAGGADGNVYIFTVDSLRRKKVCDNFPTEHDIRWVAISANGGVVSAVMNVGQGSNIQTGLLEILQNRSGSLRRIRQQSLDHPPNCTSIDDEAKFVAVADGYSKATNPHGCFYLFDGPNGNQLWKSPTDKMNWPMFISADGSSIAAGSDDGSVYYFMTA